ncbi:MAG TPA: tripartite tricarboxylate transporter substrate binding protein [Burkholderiaceae bacterium]|jgi:tripartite-type tricarboxylate transporter receptor subunit TctC|nr:tripartite tricarboxylate transporter substrate binding protein [Burkholderiaceae bacterium]
MKRRDLLLNAAALAGVSLSGETLGQPAGNWPTRPIRLILPFAVGGPTDVAARLIAVALGEQLGQPLVIENRPGAGGIIATESVIRSAPDGYTLLYHTAGLPASAAVYRNLRFDPRKDVIPVGMFVRLPAVLVASLSVPATDPKQFFAYLKTNPGKMSYGSGGVGNGSHVQMEYILRMTGSQATHVAYKGNGPAMLDLVKGEVQFMIDGLSTALPYIRDKRVRAIATMSTSREALLPDVPTLDESALPGYSNSGWNGLFAPPGTPAAIVQKLNAAINATLAQAAVKQQLERFGLGPWPMSTDEFAAHYARELDQNVKVAREANISLD